MNSRFFMISNKLLAVCLCIAILLAAGILPAQAQPANAPATLSGIFTILRGDGARGSDAAPQTIYRIADAKGVSTRIQVEDATLTSAGGLMALDRKSVTVRGSWSAALTDAGLGPVFEAASISLDESRQPEATQAESLVSGSQPFISIMCKFSDYATEPATLSYFQGMYGSPYPGLNNYWRQVSYNNINITGSTAVGWYTLPHPRSYYVGTSLDFNLAATDCTGAADPYVNFAGFTGINLMFNAELDGFAWGGSKLMVLDGVKKSWPMTWEPPWGYADITVISHEMGHAFGLPHSSGNYGQTYDNRWDVMSDTWSDCNRLSDPTYGCLGQHTIMYHKDLLGWVPASLKFTLGYAAAPTQTSIGTGAYLMAQIPFGSFGYSYTVETRQQVGYDVKLPGVGVIIHEIEPTRYNSPAHVIDSDNNGNTGDAGAIWSVGETFTDAANNVSVQVLSATANGYMVRLQNGSNIATIELDGDAQMLLFGDVPLLYWAESSITKLYNNGITGGCSTNPLLFCPDVNVTRAQMAVFLLRGMHGASYAPTAVGLSTGYNDVPTDYWAAAWIKQLAAEGITGGCGNGNFCPETIVTRDQMAVFLLRAKYGAAYNPPGVGASTGFSDVPLNYWAAPWIKQLAAEGITSGCSGANYCPTTDVNRAQMSVFLVRVFNLP